MAISETKSIVKATISFCDDRYDGHLPGYQWDRAGADGPISSESCVSTCRFHVKEEHLLPGRSRGPRVVHPCLRGAVQRSERDVYRRSVNVDEDLRFRHIRVLLPHHEPSTAPGATCEDHGL